MAAAVSSSFLVQSGGKRRMEADENLRVTFVPPLTLTGDILSYIFFCHPRNNGRRQSGRVVQNKKKRKKGGRYWERKKQNRGGWTFFCNSRIWQGLREGTRESGRHFLDGMSTVPCVCVFMVSWLENRVEMATLVICPLMLKCQLAARSSEPLYPAQEKI